MPKSILLSRTCGIEPSTFSSVPQNRHHPRTQKRNCITCSSGLAFPAPNDDTGNAWNHWQKAWQRTVENTAAPGRRQARGGWSAHMKQTSGGCIWAKLLLQYGPHELPQLLPALIAARDDRSAHQAPIWNAVRARLAEAHAADTT